MMTIRLIKRVYAVKDYH